MVTGVLDSLERDEATELIKKYGGKVTTSVSSRTSFLVTGEEAGDGKLAKVRQIEQDEGLRNRTPRRSKLRPRGKLVTYRWRVSASQRKQGVCLIPRLI